MVDSSRDQKSSLLENPLSTIDTDNRPSEIKDKEDSMVQVNKDHYEVKMSGDQDGDDQADIEEVNRFVMPTTRGILDVGDQE